MKMLGEANNKQYKTEMQYQKGIDINLTDSCFTMMWFIRIIVKFH